MHGPGRFSYFKVYIFIWKTELQRENEKDIFHLLVLFPNVCHSQGGARLKREPGTLSWSPLTGTQALGPSIATVTGALARSGIRSGAPGTQELALTWDAALTDGADSEPDQCILQMSRRRVRETLWLTQVTELGLASTGVWIQAWPQRWNQSAVRMVTASRIFHVSYYSQRMKDLTQINSSVIIHSFITFI